MRANGIESKSTAVSLDPQDATFSATEMMAISSTLEHTSKRPLRILSITELPKCGQCECGRPLVGLEIEFLHASQGDALWAVGWCIFGDGEQRTMYISEPRRTEWELTEVIRREVTELVTEAQQYRRRGDINPLDVLEEMVEGLRNEAEVGI